MKAITAVYQDGLTDFLPYQFKIEHLQGAKMGLVDYISPNPYQPAKLISKYDEEILVATLSRIHTDAKLLQQKHNIYANTLNKLYYEIQSEKQIFKKLHTEHVSNIDFAHPKKLTKDNISFALQSYSLKSSLKQSSTFVSDPAKRVHLTTNNSTLATLMYHSPMPSFKSNNSHSAHALRVCLTHNNTSLAKQMSNQKFNHNNCTNFNITHAPQIHSTKNQFAPGQSFETLKLNTPKYTLSDHDFASRVRFTQNELTLAAHNPPLFNKPSISHNSNASYANHTNNHQIKSKLASHSTNTINTPLRIEPQIELFETPNTKQASLAYQNQQPSTDLSPFNFSITNKPQISSLISTQSHLP